MEYDIYLDANVDLTSVTANGFTLVAQWHAYVRETNRAAQVPVGAWNNRLAMLADLGWVGPLAIEPHVDWRIIRSQ